MLGTSHGGKKPIRKVDRGDGLNAFWHTIASVSFIFRYRFNGKNLEVTLGKFTNNSTGIELEEARRKIKQCKGWLAASPNPALMLKPTKEERLKTCHSRRCDSLCQAANGSLTAQDRDAIASWLAVQPWVTGHRLAPLSDAWYGPWEE